MKKWMIFFALIIGIPVYAATDGALGDTSTGSLDINLNIANLVRISGLDDITLQAGSAQGGLPDEVTGRTNFCVYTNNGTGEYDITAMGSGANQNFILSDGGVNTINYMVHFSGTRDESSRENGVPLRTGVLFEATGGSNTVGTLNCNGASDENSTIWITVPEAELAGKPAADYFGTLTVQVAAK